MKKIKTFLCSVLASGYVMAGGMVDPKGAEPAVVEPIEVAPKAVVSEEPFFASWYVGASIGAAGLSTHRFGTDTVADLGVRIGYDFYRYLGVEFRASLGLNDGDRLSHDYSYGIYLKPTYAIDETFGVYGLLGYGQSKVSYPNEYLEQGILQNETVKNGIGYGVGLTYALSDTMALYAEWLRMIDESETLPSGSYAIKIDALSFGLLWRF